MITENFASIDSVPSDLLASNIRIFFDLKCDAADESTEGSEIPALISVNSTKGILSWFGFIGINTKLHDFAPVTLLPYLNSLHHPLTESLGPKGSRLQFELYPTYTLIGLVPMEKYWFSVNSSDPLVKSHLTSLACKLKAKQLTGTGKSDSGSDVFLFALHGELILAAK